MPTYSLDFERPLLEIERQIEELKKLGDNHGDELAALERQLAALRAEVYKTLTPMQRVQVARHPKRPYTLDYLRTVFTDFVELHGDRLFRDDPALVAGWARLDGQTVMVIGHQKGRDTKENLRRNFGMAHPEGSPGMLWKDASRKERAAEALKLTATDLLDLGVIDEIIPEPPGGAHSDPDAAAQALGESLRRHLRLLSRVRIEKLLKRREEKYLSMGAFIEK